jgi:hypothetical protein
VIHGARALGARGVLGGVMFLAAFVIDIPTEWNRWRIVAAHGPCPTV